MAVGSLSVTGDMPLRAFVKDATTGAVINKRFGAVSVPSLGVSLAFGSGSGQANKLYVASRTVAGTTTDNLDLAGALADGLGNTLTFTALKLALFALTSPDGTKALQIGPRGQSNPFQGSFGGTGATVYKTVKNWGLIEYEPVAGLTVTAGTGDVLGVYNPGGSSVTYWVLLAGV